MRDRMTFLLVMGLAGIMLMSGCEKGVKTEMEVRAKKFVLEDEKGETRAVLDMISDNPRLVFFDREGKNRVSVALIDDAPVIVLWDEQGKVRTQLGMMEEGIPGLWLFNEKGEVVWNAPPSQ